MEILLIEPENSQAMVAEKTLVNDGHIVVWVKSGGIGLKQLTRMPYDLCVMELELPKIQVGYFSGLDMLRAYRVQGGKIPIIALSFFDDSKESLELRTRAKRLGVIEFIEKPLAPRTLSLAVASFAVAAAG